MYTLLKLSIYIYRIKTAKNNSDSLWSTQSRLLQLNSFMFVLYHGKMWKSSKGTSASGYFKIADSPQVNCYEETNKLVDLSTAQLFYSLTEKFVIAFFLRYFAPFCRTGLTSS